jgi:hypothetical protein
MPADGRPRGGGRPSAELSAAAAATERHHSRSSAEFVVNLGPPEPMVSYGSSDGPLALPPPPGGANGAAAQGRAEGASPKARPDLLASIDEGSQLTLRYHRISAFVSTRVAPPSLGQRLRKMGRACQGAEAEPEERQARARRGEGAAGGGRGGRRARAVCAPAARPRSAPTCSHVKRPLARAPPPPPPTPLSPQILHSVSGEILPGEVLALM